MRLLAVAAFAVALACTDCRAAGTLHHPAWDLALDGDWALQARDDPEQQTASSTALDIGLTTSFLPLNVKLAGVEPLARKFQDIRLRTEHETGVRFHRTVTVDAPALAPAPGGYLLTYGGHDDTGRHFRFYGRVTQRGVLSLYVESSSRNESELAAAMDRVVAGLAQRPD